MYSVCQHAINLKSECGRRYGILIKERWDRILHTVNITSYSRVAAQVCVWCHDRLFLVWHPQNTAATPSGLNGLETWTLNIAAYALFALKLPGWSATVSREVEVGLKLRVRTKAQRSVWHSARRAVYMYICIYLSLIFFQTHNLCLIILRFCRTEFEGKLFEVKSRMVQIRLHSLFFLLPQPNTELDRR